jgi:hypothetical protein
MRRLSSGPVRREAKTVSQSDDASLCHCYHTPVARKPDPQIAQPGPPRLFQASSWPEKGTWSISAALSFALSGRWS